MAVITNRTLPAYAAKGQLTVATPPTYTFTASDAPHRFRTVGRRFVGEVLSVVEQVDVEGCGHPV